MYSWSNGRCMIRPLTPVRARGLDRAGVAHLCARLIHVGVFGVLGHYLGEFLPLGADVDVPFRQVGELLLPVAAFPSRPVRQLDVILYSVVFEPLDVLDRGVGGVTGS